MTTETVLEHGEIVNITPLECSLKGCEQIVLTFWDPVAIPDDESTFLCFCGSQVEHQTPTARLNQTSLVATIPAHPSAETLELRLCSVDGEGSQKTLYKTHFTYFLDQKAAMAEMLLSSVYDGGRALQLQYSLFPPSSSTTDVVRDHDLTLTEALDHAKIPEGWSMLGPSGREGGQINTVADCNPRETLLHFAARHGFNQLAQRLLSMPGSSIAAVLPNEQGHLPIELARENSNEGLVQLLTLYMKQITLDGKFMCSPTTSSPDASPSHTVMTREEGEMHEVRDCQESNGRGRGDTLSHEAPMEQGELKARMYKRGSLNEMVRINQEWKSKVKQHRKYSLGTLTIGCDVQSMLSQNARTITDSSPDHTQRKRRNSCIFSRDADLSIISNPCLECVGHIQDPEVAEMDRLSKTSWSRTVGSADSRSVDTGLNELHRITASETLYKKLLNIKIGLMELEHCNKTSNNHLGSDTSELNLRSLSCPMLTDTDEGDTSASPDFASSEPSSPTQQRAVNLQNDCSSSPPHGRHCVVEGNDHVKSIPRVITTAYSDELLDIPGQANSGGNSNAQIAEVHSDLTSASLSASCDDLETSSLDQREQKEPRENVKDRDERSVSLLCTEQQQEDVMTPSYSVSAPDLLVISDDNMEEQDHNSRQPTAQLQYVLVEESITEHRPLRQTGTCSPISDELRDTGTDHTLDSTNTSADSDFVMVQSPTQQQSTPRQNKDENNEESNKVGSENANVIRRSPVDTTRYRLAKSHRRSLSTSDVEVMREARKSPDEIEEGEDDRPNTSTDCITARTLTSNVNINEGDSPVLDLSHSPSRKLDMDEHSQADSIQTQDTSSLQGTDDSSDDEEETDDQLSALESQVSLNQHFPTEATIPSQTKYNGTDSHSPVVLRSGNRRSVNAINRYSAEYLVTNIDDKVTIESDDGDATPTSILPRFSHRRINSTSVPFSTVGQFEEPDHAEPAENSVLLLASGGSDNVTGMLSPGHGCDDNKKLSMCSNDSVFLNMEADVVHLSDVDIKVNNDENWMQSSLDNSMEHSAELDPQFYKETGSPKTIRKKKSPILNRRRVTTAVDLHRITSPKTQRKSLQKADVSPTIQHLKKLLVMDELEVINSLSDDSDATVGSGPFVRTGSAMETTSVQRSTSSISDSVSMHMQQQQRIQAGFNGGIGSNNDMSRTRSPLLQPTNLNEPEEEASTLDYIPGSPMAARKQHQLSNQPASPLSLSQSRSPPPSSYSQGLMSGIDQKIRSGNSSPALSASSTPGNVTPNSKAEEDDEDQAIESAVQKPFESHKQLKTAKTISFFEGGTEPSSSFVYDQKETVKEIEEGKLSLDKDHESTVKKFMRGGFFRGSKQNSKKMGKYSGKSFEVDSLQDSPVVPPIPKHLRAKSAKSRSNKPSESSLESIPSSPSSITRSASMQVGPKGEREPQNTLNQHRMSQMTRYNSDDVLSSPTKIQNGSNLDILEETPPINRKEKRSTSISPPVLPQVSAGESDEELERISLSTNHPELYLMKEVPWERTIDRKVYKKMNKAERERQAILQELLYTEKQHLRALYVLKLIFKNGISKQVSEDILEQLFPKLDELIEISVRFVKGMEAKKNGIMIDDLSDILTQQFSGDSYDQMLSAFSGFCSGQLNAMEIYRELQKKKNFARAMKEMHSLKECQRLELPDYYTKVTQRLSQLIILMIRLVKKTESLKLDHCVFLQESMQQLQCLVTAVDQSVEDRKNLMEVMDIESRLEISVPKSSKITNRQDLKNLSLTAHNRKLKKRGDATWMGHGRQTGVQVVLVTDFLVLLTERDQKFHLATLQDLKPPVIRLYDLMVRTNVSVKSGVQLLLVEQGSTPEMYKLDFADKKKAKEWLTVLNDAIDEVKEKGLKCEYFGAERVISGDEDKKAEAESEEEGKMARDKSTSSIVPAKSDPELERRSRAWDAVGLAVKLLSTFSDTDPNVLSRQQNDPITTTSQKTIQVRYRSNTTRPKTSYFSGADELDGVTISSVTLGGHTTSGEHVISYPVPKGTKLIKEKKKINRSVTFRSKEKKDDKKEEKEKQFMGMVSQPGNVVEENSRIPEQPYLKCITALKSSLEEMIGESDEKTRRIDKLHDELLALQKAFKYQKVKVKRRSKLGSPTHSMYHQSPHSIPPPTQRPHSTYVDLNNLDDSPNPPLHPVIGGSASDLCSSKNQPEVGQSADDGTGSDVEDTNG